MKSLISAAIAVALLQATLQMAWAKPQAPLQQIHDNRYLSHAGEMLSIITQVATQIQKRSLVRPTRQAVLGSCSQTDIANSLSGYPDDCVRRLSNIDLTGGDIAEVAELADGFCNMRCGQPLLDLFNDCNFPEAAVALVYTCSINENGDTCGRILQATTDAVTQAESACLPPSTTCSNNCQTSLQNFRDAVGCCGNFTEVGQFGMNAEIDDFTLWNSCGVNVTGLCTEGAFNSGATLAVTKVTLVGFAILILLL